MPKPNVKAYTQETQLLAAFLLVKKAAEQRARLSTPVWVPNPGAQTMALHSPAHELFYGGAAGGGKTDLLIGAALTVHYQSIIFRREFPQLREIVRRSTEVFALLPVSGAVKPKYNSTDHLWHGLPGGKTLEFGSIPLLKDREKYQGRPHDLKGWDEIANFLRDMYIFVSAWTRTTRPGQRFRNLCTGNPPTTPEGEWIIEHWRAWLDPTYEYPAKPGELRWFATLPDERATTHPTTSTNVTTTTNSDYANSDWRSVEVENGEKFYFKGQVIIPRSRSFIPALLADNPILADTGYAAVVMSLPEPLRSQLLFGRFDIKPDADEWQVIPTQWVLDAQERWKRQPSPQTGITALGVDPSRGGRDRTIIAARYANWYDHLMSQTGGDTPDGDAVAKFVIEAAFQMQSGPAGEVWQLEPNSYAANIPINVDALGAGASAFDSLKRANARAYDVLFNESTIATDFTGKLPLVNLRAEAYWLFREALDPTYGADICLPPDRELAAELTAHKWKMTPRGIQIEEKADVKERLGRSPDRADAVVLAWLDMVGKRTATVQTSTSARTYGQPTPINDDQSILVEHLFDEAEAYSESLYIQQARQLRRRF